MYGADPRRQHRIRLLFAGTLTVLGVGALVALLATGQSFPRPIWHWVAFAIAAVYFEWRSVEVNDRLFASPSLMVVTTAAVVFGRESAILGVVAMVGLGLLTPADLKGRR